VGTMGDKILLEGDHMGIMGDKFFIGGGPRRNNG